MVKKKKSDNKKGEEESSENTRRYEVVQRASTDAGAGSGRTDTIGELSDNLRRITPIGSLVVTTLLVV